MMLFNFPSICVHSHLLSHEVQGERESAHFTERINEYPGGSILLVFGVRGASTYWLLSLLCSFESRSEEFGWGQGEICHGDLSGLLLYTNPPPPQSFSPPTQSRR